MVDANLNGASFWNAKFDDSFPQGFEGTAWWLAVGWNSRQLDKLSELPRPDFRNSGPETVERYREKLRSEESQTNVDRLSLADELNSYAWWLAINGATNEPDQPSTAGILDQDLESFCSKADSDHAKFPGNVSSSCREGGLLDWTTES
jgi:hypothetical protein